MSSTSASNGSEDRDAGEDGGCRHGRWQPRPGAAASADLTDQQKKILAVVLVVHLIVARFTLRDLRRRPRGRRARSQAAVAPVGDARTRRARWPTGCSGAGAPTTSSDRLLIGPDQLQRTLTRSEEEAQHRRVALDRQRRPDRRGSTARGRGRPPPRSPCRRRRRLLPARGRDAVAVEVQRPGGVDVARSARPSRGRHLGPRPWRSGAARSQSRSSSTPSAAKGGANGSDRQGPRPVRRRPGGWPSRGPGGGPTWRAGRVRAGRSSTRRSAGAAVSAATSAAHPWRNQAASSASSGPAPTISSRPAPPISVRAPAT